VRRDVHLQLSGIDIRALGSLDSAADRLTENEARTAHYRTGAVGPISGTVRNFV
jgi:hypothetical protein